MCPRQAEANKVVQQRLIVSGRVQGVGFRPYIFRLANELKLCGSVCNTHHAVTIEISGTPDAIEAFNQRMPRELPPNALIEHIESPPAAEFPPSKDFRVITSSSAITSNDIFEVPADVGICKQCISELFDPDNRRYLHPFITCTDCGPRYSIIKSLPYDREHTSMNAFTMCQHCEQEYTDPKAKQRLHSQTNCCHDCGPRLHINKLPNNTAIDSCVKKLKAGAIIAVKGMGGFHLICDANNQAAVQMLRARKQRQDKPFAIMALNAASFEDLVMLNDNDRDLLQASTTPIVLLPKRTPIGEPSIPPAVADRVSDLGCMLPYTALHYLLIYKLLGEPKGQTWLHSKCPIQLIVTSANLSGEPIISGQSTDDYQALSQLADIVLDHDREIIAPSDDTVIQSGKPASIIRRARGLVPQAITLPSALGNEPGCVLALGAQFKNTFCLTKGDRAYLSPHMGELNSAKSYSRYQATIQHFRQLFEATIEASACDQHPDYVSTHFAEKHSVSNNLALFKIQHHQAHLAAIEAESHLFSRHTNYIGLVLDGVGLGLDQQAWGGELFHAQPNHYARIAHLETLALPGGDIASQEIWRIGAHLLSKHYPDLVDQYYQPFLDSQLKRQFILQGTHLDTSSMGRWFDAIASLIGLRQKITFEAQAAMELEALAIQNPAIKATSAARIDSDNTLLLSPLLKPLLDASSPTVAAGYFMRELIDGLARWLTSACKQHQTNIIALSGGCFQNRILRETLTQTLTSLGFQVYLPKLSPANDGGISLGQALIAARASLDAAHLDSSLDNTSLCV